MTVSPLTIKHGGLTNVIKSEAAISIPFLEGDPAPEIKKYTAVWDTGAMSTVITQKIVDDLKLKQIDMVPASSATTSGTAPVYLVNLMLPSNVTITGVRVIQMNVQGSDILIGMDIITLGDFSITNHEGKTCMSFRIPSSHEIDYVKDAQIAALPRHMRRHLPKGSK
jgi:hypothetical protein